MTRPKVRVKRIYDDPSADDGARVLVDRIWPRGMSKERAHLDEWLKAVAPSTELRTWYKHDPDRWEEFGRRYEQELDGDGDQAEAFARLRTLQNEGRVTLLTASRAVDISEAQVLAELLNGER
ncbi:MAG: DUF488 domain-containing protein [Acidobacteria bacterium]|nr:MAG: DUF488 domain-containing protein [Acidobacteriota bacterium]